MTRLEQLKESLWFIGQSDYYQVADGDRYRNAKATVRKVIKELIAEQESKEKMDAEMKAHVHHKFTHRVPGYSGVKNGVPVFDRYAVAELDEQC